MASKSPDEPPLKERISRLEKQFQNQLEAEKQRRKQLETKLKAIKSDLASISGLDSQPGRRQALAYLVAAGGVGFGLANIPEPARADAVAADVGTQADPWQKGWFHELESGDGADALGFGDAVAFDHEAVSSATTIGNVTLVIYDSSVSGFTITIPSSLEQNGMVVRFIDQTGNADTNNVVVENSSNSTILTLDAADTIFEVWWDGSEWLDDIITDTLDARKVATEELSSNIENGSEVSASRSLDSEETNNTGHLLFVLVTVSVSSNGTTVGMEAQVADTSANLSSDTKMDDVNTTFDNGERANVQFIVPDGFKYKIVTFGDTGNFSLKRWIEKGFV